MNAQRRKWLKETYGYDDWALGDEGVHGVQVTEGLVDGWILRHVDRENDTDLPLEQHAVFSCQDPAKRQALAVDIWECDGTAAARECLIDVLGKFESPSLERVRGEASVGDITFAFKEWTILFARSNIIVLLRNAGRELVLVAEIARDLDAKLTSNR